MLGRNTRYAKLLKKTAEEENEPLPDNLLEALKLLDDGFLTEAEETAVLNKLRKYPQILVHIIDKTIKDTYLIDGTIVEADDNSIWMYPIDRWLDSADNLRDEIADKLAENFNIEFQEYPAPLYHATPKNNLDSILRQGLHPENRTRGLTNRGVGAAIFTVIDPESAALGSYGDTVIRIDVPQMKKDGVNFRVEMEPSVFENEAAGVLADSLGISDYAWSAESDRADDPNTVILHTRTIAPKYLSVV